jgi:hypothetical protein
MDGRTDPLNDAALEQEVEALLSVQPSPEFVARVRSRVADESMSAGSGWRWPIAAVAMTVAVAVIGTVLWQSVEQTAPPAPQLTAASLDSVPNPPGPDLESHIVPPEVVSVVAPRRSIDIALPAVIIAENETRAYAVLIASRSTRRVEVSSSTARTVADPIEVDKMPAIEPVALAPIEIEPLVKVVELE